MNIQWFPGHMRKALNTMKECSPLVDSFIYVLDSRAVFASINHTFDSIIGAKPILYILNKSDLIEKSDLDEICTYFASQGMTYVTCNSKTGASVKEIFVKIKQINSDKLNRYKEKNFKKAIRAMVIGIPNTGKSTLINSMCASKKTITGNKPGVTKGKQWVVVDSELELLDTPGTLCPSFDNKIFARDVAFIGSIRDQIMDMEELAYELIAFLRANYPSAINDRYKITCDDMTAQETVDAIAKSRGFVIHGGEFDYDRAYNAVLDDYRKGKFGKIAFEKP